MGDPETEVPLADSVLIELRIVACPTGPATDQKLAMRLTLKGDPLSCVRDTEPLIRAAQDPPQSNPRRIEDPHAQGQHDPRLDRNP